MSKSRKILLATAFSLIAAPAMAEGLGLGRAALPEEIAAWDVAVLPDGTGLRPGSGDVQTGDEVFYEKCASCHGDFAEGIDSWPVLAGGMGTLTDARPVKTIGSYWPHLSTVYDYVHRSMPFGGAQTLSVDEAYAITAFLLYSNGLVEDDFVLTHENFTEISMPNAEGFYVDDRPQVEYPKFSAPPCMTDCRATAPEVTKRAIELNVTPRDPDGKPAGTIPATQVQAAAEAAPAETRTAEAEVPAPEAAPAATAIDPALIAQGEKVFKKCAACHKLGEGARNGTGPALAGILGHPVAAAEGFKYSGALKDMGADGAVWDGDSLHSFLESPKTFAKGTKMSFAGLKSPEDRAAVIAFIESRKP